LEGEIPRHPWPRLPRALGRLRLQVHRQWQRGVRRGSTNGMCVCVGFGLVCAMAICDRLHSFHGPYMRTFHTTSQIFKESRINFSSWLFEISVRLNFHSWKMHFVKFEIKAAYTILGLRRSRSRGLYIREALGASAAFDLSAPNPCARHQASHCRSSSS